MSLDFGQLGDSSCTDCNPQLTSWQTLYLPRYRHIATILAACFLTIISQLHMFRWPKSTHKSTTGYEPKTPKITSIALPDERNSPFKYQPLYIERSSTRNSFFKRFSTADSRPTTPLKRNSIIGGVPQSRLFARTRTVSACVREVEGMALSSLSKRSF
jgi:hypothetical protein